MESQLLWICSGGFLLLAKAPGQDSIGTDGHDLIRTNSRGRMRNLLIGENSIYW